MGVRPIDTSELGPIRVALPGDMTPRQLARERYADSLRARGRGWHNAAEAVRCGSYANEWVLAGIDAVEAAMREGSG